MNILGSGASKSLVIRFIADTTRANANINTLINQLRQVGGVGGKVTGGLTGGLHGVAGAFGVASAAALAFGFALRQVFHYGTMVENQMTSMKQFLGSDARVSEMMKNALDYSVRTPFTPAQVFSATQQLVQAGIDPYGKGKYGLGKDKMAMDIIGGMGSYMWRGKRLGMEHAVMALQRGETRMLKPYGRDVLGVHEKALTAGIAGGPAYMAKFFEEAGKLPQIMNMAKAQSETIAGLWSTIAGFAQIAFIKIAGPDAKKGVVTMWSLIKDIMLDIRATGMSFMIKNELLFREIGKVIGGVFKFVYQYWKLINAIFMPLSKVFKESFVVWLSIFGYLLRTTGTILSYFTSIVDKIFELTGLTAFFNDIIRGIKELYGWLQAMFVIFDIWLEQTYSSKNIEEAVKFWKAAILSLFEPLDALGEKLDNLINKIPIIGRVFTTLRDIGGWILNKDAELTSRYWRFTGKLEDELQEAFLRKLLENPDVRKSLNLPAEAVPRNPLQPGPKIIINAHTYNEATQEVPLNKGPLRGNTGRGDESGLGDWLDKMLPQGY